MKLFEQPIEKLLGQKALKQLNSSVNQNNLNLNASSSSTSSSALNLSLNINWNNIVKRKRRASPSAYLRQFSLDLDNSFDSDKPPSVKCYSISTLNLNQLNESTSSSIINYNNGHQCRKIVKSASQRNSRSETQRYKLLHSILPKPIKNLLNELYSRAPTTVGIFRKSPNARQCKELRHKLETDSTSPIGDFHVTVIASVFKVSLHLKF